MTEYPAKDSYYGDVATSYDAERFTSLKGRWIDKRERLSVTRALRRLPQESTVLDLPCGTGRITQHVLSLGHRVTGADISNEMIDLARRRIGDHPRLEEFRRLDAERIELGDDSFDAVTSVRLMGHLPEDAKLRALSEMARVARRFVVVTFYLTGPVRRIKWLLQHGGHPLSQHPAWYPTGKREAREICRKSRLRVVGEFRVAPIVSDGFTLLLEPSGMSSVS